LDLAGTTFHQDAELRSLEEIRLADAPALLQRLLGTQIAPVAFAIALLASGQSSTITGTLAGQVVMEGFVHLRLRPWARRLLTRSLALVPALFVIALAGSEAPVAAAAEQDGGVSVVDQRLLQLLVLSQVVLSF